MRFNSASLHTIVALVQSHYSPRSLDFRGSEGSSHEIVFEFTKSPGLIFNWHSRSDSEKFPMYTYHQGKSKNRVRLRRTALLWACRYNSRHLKGDQPAIIRCIRYGWTWRHFKVVDDVSMNSYVSALGWPLFSQGTSKTISQGISQMVFLGRYFCFRYFSIEFYDETAVIAGQRAC